VLEDNRISSRQERPTADTSQSQPQEDIFDIARVDKPRKDDGLAKIGNYVGRDAIMFNTTAPAPTTNCKARNDCAKNQFLPSRRSYHRYCSGKHCLCGSRHTSLTIIPDE
jgi:hypothetical protein